MEELADRYADRKVKSVFLYTREAHPGELHPHLTSLDDKLANAREMAERVGIRRTMLVDDLQGSVHRAYGILPNMTYVVARRGRIVYRAAWTDSRTVEWMLEEMTRAVTEQRDGNRILNYYMEAEVGKVANRKPFLDALRKYGGMRAADEYIEALASTHGEDAAAPCRRWRASVADSS